MSKERTKSEQILLEQTCSEVNPKSSTGDGESSPDVKPYYCGIGPCHPKWLQWFATAKFFTFILSLNGLIEGALVSGFTSVVLSTIEKRYRFSSLAASMIIAVFDFTVVVSVVFISYFGHKSHKPRWLGIALIIQGIGAFIFALPEFIFGEYQVGSDAKFRFESCDNNTAFTTSCTPANNIAYGLFILANILIGIGAAPLFTIGTSFIDDIVHPKYVSIHLGLFYTTSVVGPAIGYGLGGAFLSIYVDPWLSTHLEETDPGWVGAWWLGFIFSGIVSVLCAIPFLMFPRKLKDTHLIQEIRRKEMALTYKSKYKDEESLIVQLKTFPAHVCKLFQSASYVFITLGATILFFSLDGMVSFGPKYIESVFNVPASTASISVAAVVIITGGLGVIAGAVVVFLIKSKPKNVAAIPWVISIFAMPSTLAFLFSCPNSDIAGIHTALGNSSVTFSSTDVLLSSCNYDCSCSSSVFEPVCGADGLTYFSPCRAGCQKYITDGNINDPEFENCSCVTENFYQGAAYDALLYTGNDTATDGKCTTGGSCYSLIFFLLLLGILVFLIFFLRIPTVLVTIRAVAEEQRSLALGVQSVFFRLFGAIPGPIVFGAIIDSGCIYWQFECGRRGNCWVYDTSVLGIRGLSLSLSGIFLNVILCIFCWLFYPPINCKSKALDTKEEKALSTDDNVFYSDKEDPKKEVKF